MASINIDFDINEKIKEVQQLVDELSELETSLNKLVFVTIEDVCKSTGWSAVTVQNLFNRKDFPSCDYGKTKIAEVSAVKKYFSVPRRK